MTVRSHAHRLLRARSTAGTSPWSAGAVVMLVALLAPVAAYAQGPAHLLKDINANRTGSRPSNLAQVDGTLFFTNVDLNTGLTELWKSNGIEAGTVLVKRVQVSSPLTRVGRKCFFRAIDTSGELQLWTSDGTAVGTVQVGNGCAPGSTHRQRPWRSTTAPQAHCMRRRRTACSRFRMLP
jgi:ELWxxDGT repeat protein